MQSKNQGSQHTWTVPCCSASPPGWSESFACCVNIWQLLVKPVREKPREFLVEKLLGSIYPMRFLNLFLIPGFFWHWWSAHSGGNKTKQRKQNTTLPNLSSRQMGQLSALWALPGEPAFTQKRNLSWLWARHFMFFVLPVPQGGLRYFFFLISSGIFKNQYIVFFM